MLQVWRVSDPEFSVSLSLLQGRNYGVLGLFPKVLGRNSFFVLQLLMHFWVWGHINTPTSVSVVM